MKNNDRGDMQREPLLACVGSDRHLVAHCASPGCQREAPCDPTHWTSVEPDTAAKREIHVQFLRQHPYEFLPALVSGIKTRMSPQ